MRKSPLDGMTVAEYDRYQDELNTIFDGRKIKARRVHRGPDKKPRFKRTKKELSLGLSVRACKVRRFLHL